MEPLSHLTVIANQLIWADYDNCSICSLDHLRGVGGLQQRWAVDQHHVEAGLGISQQRSCGLRSGHARHLGCGRPMGASTATALLKGLVAMQSCSARCPASTCSKLSAAGTPGRSRADRSPLASTTRTRVPPSARARARLATTVLLPPPATDETNASDNPRDNRGRVPCGRVRQMGPRSGKPQRQRSTGWQSSAASHPPRGCCRSIAASSRPRTLGSRRSAAHCRGPQDPRSVMLRLRLASA